MAKNEENIHAGHRQKALKKFTDNIENPVLEDHELLEVLLFFSIRRRNTNDIGHKLIKDFGSLKGVFDAPYEALKNTGGIGPYSAALIKLVSVFIRKYHEDMVKEIKTIETTEDAVEYLRPKFIGKEKESLLMLCLNNAGKILKCSVISHGGRDFTEADMGKIYSELLNTNATAVILAHNHPGGVCAPSREDHETTVTAARLLTTMNVRLLNHIIITENDYFSFASNPKYSECFTMKSYMFEPEKNE